MHKSGGRYLLELVLQTILEELDCNGSQIILTSKHRPPGSSPRLHLHLLLPSSVYPLPKALVSPFFLSVTCLKHAQYVNYSTQISF